MSVAPGVAVHGNVTFGTGVSWCEPGEANGTGSFIEIGDNCDLAAFVVLNVADSHMRCLELWEDIDRRPIVLGNNVFVGSHCFIAGGFTIGHHSVIAAGTILTRREFGSYVIPPYSLVQGNPWQVIEGHYKPR